MKRIFCVLLVFLLVLPGCIRNDKIEIGDSYWEIFDKYEYIFRDTIISVFKVDGEYIAVVTYNDRVIKKAHFTSDRKGYNAEGLTLIENVDANEYIGLTIGEVEKMLGRIHADIGSGLYIPSYITKDGYLLSFHMDTDQNTICGYMKFDMLDTTTPDEIVFEN